MMPMSEEEHAGHGGAEDAGDLLQRGGVVLDLPGQRPHAEREQRAPARRRSMEWPEARTRSRRDSGRLPVGHQLAGGVVDGGDVVGVEGVPHAERVRRHAEPDAEDLVPPTW